MTFADFLAPYALEWQKLEGSYDARLRRLAILRKLAVDLHSLISTLLTQGKRSGVPEATVILSRIEALPGKASPLVGPLHEVLVNESTASGSSLQNHIPTLPSAYYRPDRQWEHAIALEALNIGWSLWSFEASVPLLGVTDWHSKLEASLAPHAILLFVESVDSQAEDPLSHWRGRWHAAFGPKHGPALYFSAECLRQTRATRLGYSP